MRVVHSSQIHFTFVHEPVLHSQVRIYAHNENEKTNVGNHSVYNRSMRGEKMVSTTLTFRQKDQGTRYTYI